MKANFVNDKLSKRVNSQLQNKSMLRDLFKERPPKKRS